MSERQDQTDRMIWEALSQLQGTAAIAGARAHAERLTVEAAARRARREAWAGFFRLPRLALVGSVAAAVALAVLVLPPRDTLRTDVGEIRTKTLADGSTVTLNTDTRLRVEMMEKERRIKLLEGQARFDVAHDAARPFRVEAGGIMVTALGTAFDVAALPRGTTVTLIEGKVVVDVAASKAPARVALAPGEQLVAKAEAKPVKRPARMAAALAWQRREVDINSLSLAEALAEVNRYSDTKVRVLDSSLQDAKVSGVFRTGDVEAVSYALQSYFDLKVVRRSEEEILLDRAGG